MALWWTDQLKTLRTGSEVNSINAIHSGKICHLLALTIRQRLLAHMAEQWIEASAALRIAGNIDSLCARLHSGLAQARAAKFEVGDEVRMDAVVPKGFWWAEGHESLKQDWATGDFSTWIDDKRHCRAFGVHMALSGVLEMVEFERRPLIVRSLSVATHPDSHEEG